MAKVLKEYERMLKPFDFVRIHKSILINKSRIRQFDGNASIIMDDESQLRVSRRRIKAVSRLILATMLCLVMILPGAAQSVAINATGAEPDSSALLDLSSSDKGLLIPRMSTAGRLAISNPAIGLVVFDTTLEKFSHYTSAGWSLLLSNNMTHIHDADTNTMVETEQTQDEDKIRFIIDGQEKWVMEGNRLEPVGNNIAIGESALYSNSVGSNNIAIGNNALYQNTDGTDNMAFGASALYANTSGWSNLAIGKNALHDNTTGFSNMAIGESALYSNTYGEGNLAIGLNALHENSSGVHNLAVGDGALYSNTTGWSNLAIGINALSSNTSGLTNMAIGELALTSNIDGMSNLAIGVNALRTNSNGNNNLAMGEGALYFNSSGWHNLAIGKNSLFSNTNGGNNLAIGMYGLNANTTGFSNVAIGNSALASNTVGVVNLAIGEGALYANQEGYQNLALGYVALLHNTGSQNVAIGAYALQNNTDGATNLAIGLAALRDNTASNNLAIGRETMIQNTTGSGNIAIGAYALNAGTTTNTIAIGYQACSVGTYNNAIGIGYQANPTEDNEVMIGNTYVTSIGGEVGWTNFSDGRIKKDLRHDVPGISFINQLEPVTYFLDVEEQERLIYGKVDANNWAGKDDIKSMRMSGFVAQDVEAVAQSIGYDFSGIDAPQNENGLYGLRYAEFVVPLVKAVQELSDQNAALLSAVEALTLQYQQLQAEITALKESE